MEIETVNNPAYKTEIKFESLKPGTVFELESGIKALKLHQDDHVLLTYSDGADWVVAGNGNTLEACKITKVWGKLVGLKVRL